MSSPSPSARRPAHASIRERLASLPLAIAVALAALPVLTPAAPAQGNRGGPPVEVKPSFGAMRSDRGTESRVADLLKVHVRLKLDEKSDSFAGDVVNDVEWLEPGAREIWFDAEEMKISGAKVDGKEAPFRQEPHRVVVTLPAPAVCGQKAAIEIDYAVEKPHRGLWFIHPSADEPAL